MYLTIEKERDFILLPASFYLHIEEIKADLVLLWGYTEHTLCFSW